MPTGLAILFSIGLLFFCYVIDVVTGLTPRVTILMVFGTALWAAFDYRKTKYEECTIGMYNSPIITFFLIMLFWIITFPWYLSARGKTKRKQAELKDQYKEKPLIITSSDILDQLEKLGELKEKGILTDEEFQGQKAKLLSSQE